MRKRRALSTGERLESRFALCGNWEHSTDSDVPSDQGGSQEFRSAPPAAAADIAAADIAAAGIAAAGIAAAAQPLTAIPLLHSRASATAKLYLDFDGHFEANWGRFANLTTPPYNADGDPATFSDSELANIESIWARVAEDFAPFHIDVTTELPTSFANRVAQRIAIGGSSLDWYDPTGGDRVGGYAYISAFTGGTPNVAYVFPAQLGGGNATKNIADASSHEAGHSFGLRHQSLYAADGTKTAEYNPGGGEWAPVMGISYSAMLSTWHHGTSTSATNMQDDMAVISGGTNGFGYRPDDHGDTAAGATLLTSAGGILSGSGVIERNNDVDAFSIATDAGNIAVTLAVAPLGPNLDAILELRNSANEIIASANPTTTLGASIHANVPAGNYTLFVRNTGDYGRVGQYTLTGAVADASPVRPRVVISSTDWAAAFVDRLSELGLGENGIELSEKAGAAPLLPWVNLNTIHVVFSEPVDVSREDLQITGLATPDYSPSIAAFHYDPVSFTATWRFASPFAADRVQVALSGSIRDAGGNLLPSSQPRQFDVVPGDVTRDREVRVDDFFASLSRQFSGVLDEAYDIAADLDGNAAVNVLDWQHVFAQWEPAEPAPGVGAAAAVDFADSAAAYNELNGSRLRAVKMTQAVSDLLEGFARRGDRDRPAARATRRPGGGA
jgi:hypothetical protein